MPPDQPGITVYATVRGMATARLLRAVLYPVGASLMIMYVGFPAPRRLNRIGFALFWAP